MAPDPIWGSRVNHQTPAKSRESGFTTLLFGLLLTGVFYGVAPLIPGISEFVRRYFFSHVLEVISTAMFFMGIAILIRKTVRLPGERRVLSEATEAFAGGELSAAAETMDDRRQAVEQWCDERESGLQNTYLLERLREAVQYVQASRSGGLEEHLRYLAELAGERLHQSLAMLRTITWAIPILGFLGTVIGITLAIANVTPEQLDSSLGEVTGGLAVAFDTTALALGMSIVLVFASFLVERNEQRVLSDVERFGIDNLLFWFDEGRLSAETDTKADDGFSHAIQAHAEVWASELGEFRESWSSLLTEHVAEFRQQLDQDAQTTLELHRSDACDARDSYAEALHTGVEQLTNQLEQVMVQFDDRVNRWQQALLTSSRASAAQAEELHRLGQTMLRMTETEERLAELQKQLNDNLQSIQVAETLEQTVNSLTAAVHVLTAKTAHRSAA
jgi:biopolymer transport protein ExbB/TolQ